MNPYIFIFTKETRISWFISGGVIIVSQRTAPTTLAQHVAHPLIVGEVIGSNLGPTPHHTKDVKNGSYCCYVRCVI